MPNSPKRSRFAAAIKRIFQLRERGWKLTVFKWLAIFGVSGFLATVLTIFGLYLVITPGLPDVESLSDVQLQMPLRIYTADGDLISEYGEKRRGPVLISAVPENLKNAIIAAEDKRFYEHPGVDYQGLMRAALHVLKTGKKGPGGSTITMQVARNFFLSNEKTYARKLTEIFLSFKIEDKLAKDQILELYINKIYLGNRSYGFAAASKVYYGKQLDNIDLAEAAMLAGLPKAPSRFNPIVNPERAVQRRNYVLGRMLALKMIEPVEYEIALSLPATAELHSTKPIAESNYVGEMVRARVEQLFGDAWSTSGFNVYTTIRSNDQQAANHALRTALYDYERRHGFRGPLATFDPSILAEPDLLKSELSAFSTHGGMMPAAVMAVDALSATVMAKDGFEYVLPFEDIEWAREYIDVDTRGEKITEATQALAVGDVIQLQTMPDGSVRFVQEPTVEGALVAVDPFSGAITALVGGFDYYRSKFNRATQARRQPGSTFKPFIYSAALDAGNTAATIYNDAPVVFHDDALEGEWRPTNYSGRFFGPTRLREALVKSRNLVSVRVMREIGIPYSVKFAERFGFKPKHLPPDLSLSLGSAAVTPVELTTAFSVFANGGFRVQPFFIDRIEDPRGALLYAAPKVVFCDGCDDDDPNVMQPERAVTDEDAEAAQIEPVLEVPVNSEMEFEIDPETGLEILPEIDGDTLLTDTRLDTVVAPRVISEGNAFIMSSMMREVVQRGTAHRAGKALRRSDLGGKTGTTNNQLDAWFTGFNSKVVATAWVGSDGLQPLGRRESGGIAALPMWTTFIANTLGGDLEDELIPPDDVATVRIDKKTGEPTVPDEFAGEPLFAGEVVPGDGTMMEYFILGTEPEGSVVVQVGDGLDNELDGTTDGTFDEFTEEENIELPIDEFTEDAPARPRPEVDRRQKQEVDQLF